MTCCILLVAACLFLYASPAVADSWGPPQPQLATAEDGGWYVAFNPGETYSGGTVLLVRRAPGKAEEGDVVVARTESHVPMDLRCLNGGKGFVLFDTYASVGMGTVVARYDAESKLLWKKELADFFSPARAARGGEVALRAHRPRSGGSHPSRRVDGAGRRPRRCGDRARAQREGAAQGAAPVRREESAGDPRRGRTASPERCHARYGGRSLACRPRCPRSWRRPARRPSTSRTPRSMRSWRSSRLPRRR